MGKISCPEKRRVPEQVGGIQVNHCKNPLCINFGVSVSNEKQSRGRYANPLRQDGYTAGQTSTTADKRSKDGQASKPRPIDITPHFTCKFCGETFPAKSNLGISEETGRLGAYLEREPAPSCPNESCVNHGKAISENKALYKNKGFTTKAKAARKYLCKSCGGYFTVQVKTTKRQRIPQRNKYIFKALCNKVPLRCIADIFDLTQPTVYNRIDFLYEQCRKFVAARERRLAEGMRFRRMYLSVDRQIYLVNWLDRKVKRNIPLYATGTADNDSKYVFSMDLNYDPSLDPEEIERAAERADDYSRYNPFRDHSRIWLRKDFEAQSLLEDASLEPSFDPTLARIDHELSRVIKGRYKEAASRLDVESGDKPTRYVQLPRKGMIVRLDYNLYGHFFHLRKLLPGVKKIRFFLDQESGIRAACLSAFRDRIMARECDAFYVSINREMTIDERRKARAEGQELLSLYRKDNSNLSISQAKLQILIERLRAMSVYGQYRDRWFDHPFPTVAEPEKKVCYLTDLKDYTMDHLAWLHNKASLVGINQFFMNLRRKQSMLERPISTPSSLNRKWYGYSPYNPAMINKILLIHRVWYNYARQSRRTTITRAMKLGLAKGPVDVEKIIYGQKISEKPLKAYFLNGHKPDPSKSFLLNPEPESEDQTPIEHVELETETKRKPSAKAEIAPDKIETVFLDTETTGIEVNSHIVEIAIVDNGGNVLVNSLVKSPVEISAEASKVNGITMDMLADAPTLLQLEADIVSAVKGKRVVIYASHFDVRYLAEEIITAAATINCCMRKFADYYATKEQKAKATWKSLKFACQYLGQEWYGKQHRALGDAMACRAVWRKINE